MPGGHVAGSGPDGKMVWITGSGRPYRTSLTWMYAAMPGSSQAAQSRISPNRTCSQPVTERPLGRGPAVADRGQQGREDEQPGEAERRRVPGVRHEQAEHDRAGAVAGVVGQVPQGAGGAVAAGGGAVDHQ